MIGLILAFTLTPMLPNPSFELGKGDRPRGWRCLGGEGLWESRGRGGGRCVSVVGNGFNSNKWISELVELEPVKLRAEPLENRGGETICWRRGHCSFRRDGSTRSMSGAG